jgi:hypothetical protein
MELRFIFFANAAESGPDGRFFVLGGGFDTIIVPATPIVMSSLAIVVQLAFTAEEAGQPRAIRISISNPNGEDFGLAPVVNANPQTFPTALDTPMTLNACFMITNLPLGSQGAYPVRCFIDDQLIGEHQFWVTLPRQPEPDGAR